MLPRRKSAKVPAVPDDGDGLPPLHGLQTVPFLSTKALAKLGTPAAQLGPPSPVARRMPSSSSLHSLNTGGMLSKFRSKHSNSRSTESHPSLYRNESSYLTTRPSASDSAQSGRKSSSDSLLRSDDPNPTSSASSLGSPPPSKTTWDDGPRSPPLTSASSSHKTYKMHVPEPAGSPIPSEAADSQHRSTPPAKSGDWLGTRGNRAAMPAEGQSAAEDATEEIVPWMFDAPTDAPSPRTARARHRSTLSSGSVDLKFAAKLRNSKSVSNIRQRNSGDSYLDSPDRSKSISQGKGFFGRLKRKLSKPELVNDYFAADNNDSPRLAPTSDYPDFLNPFPIPKSPSMGSLASTSRKSFSTGKLRTKMQKAQKTRLDRVEDPRGVTEAQALAASSTGVTLDTNMDQMDGIVSLTARTGQGSFTGFLNEAAPQRPQTPDSLIANSLIQRRRPSMAPSSALDSLGSNDTPNHSPLSTRSGGLFNASRRASMVPGDPLWNPSYAAAGIGISVDSAHGTYVTLEENRPSIGASRKVSAGMQAAANANAARAAAHGAPAPGSVEAGWTAPESWAVEEVLDGDLDADHSDDEAEPTSSPAPGAGWTGTPLLTVDEETRRGSIGRSSDGRPGSKGRPGTATERIRDPTRGPNYSLRVFKPDGSHTTIVTPFSQTVAEIQCVVARKPGFVTGKGIHKMFVRERGLERPMGLNERPIRAQQLRLEQAGYTEWDRPEDLGRQDHSYLIKFIFKPDVAPRSGSDDFNMTTYEYVDLRARSLMTIPIFLYNHAHDIVSLNLSRNAKLDLPADFVQLCTALRELRLSDTYIKRIPQSVRQATGLTRLDISSNRLLEMDHIRLDEIKELILLEAYDNRLQGLPDYFANFAALKYLNVSNNKFEAFPDVICSIVTLIDLDLSFNSLPSIPAEISKLKNLERFHIVGNMITALPTTFEALHKLQEFDCRQNNIESFAVLSEVPRLLSLRCDYNRCSVLNLHSSTLRSFSISYNPLTRFNIIGTGVSLTQLNISHGKLVELDPECFKNLNALETLIFDSNQIRTLSEELGTLTSLLRLSGKNNKLESLPESIGNLSRLQYLNVANNNLGELPATIWFAPDLIYLNASSNLLDDFPDPPASNPNEDREHDIIDRKMSAASKISISRGGSPLALSLQELYLADNRLVDEIFHPVSLMTDLRILNLSFNDIVEIPHRTLSKEVQLEELYLSGNKLQTLPEDDFERLVNLRTIHLNGNKLTTLPAELGTLKKLQILDVGSNMLKYNIANWKYDWNWNWNLELRYLNLSGNKRLEIKPAGTQAVQTTDGSPSTAKRRNLSDFSSLRKIRTLGLMDVTLTIPSIPDDNEERRVRTSSSEINDMGYGIADTLGATDNLAIIDLVVPKFRSKDDECIFGIFDSQMQPKTGGARLAKYLQDCFGATLAGELNRMVDGESDVTDVLRRTFLNINRDYGNIIAPSDGNAHRRPQNTRLDGKPRNQAADIRSGASGVVAYISGKTLYVANVGRSLAVLANRNGQARPMTTKHEPLSRDEWTQIRHSEGWVSNKGFVNDELDVSKSFGHYHVFPHINASPAIQIQELTEGDELIILANRGFWDFVDYQTAVDIARSERADPMIAAQKLRDLAIAYGSTAHTMVMVVSIADMFKIKMNTRRKGGASADADSEGYLNRVGRAKGTANVAPTERYLALMDREIPAPTGMVALVFTDIRNSTSLWDSNPGMHVAIRMHNQLLRRQLRSIGGYEVKTEGDAFMCSFPSVIAAVLWAFTVQLELLREDWPVSILDCEDGMEILDSDGMETLYRGLSVRMGIHWGLPHCETDPITRRMDYFGPIVNRAARVTALAEGGQITASADVVEIIRGLCQEKPDGANAEQLDELDELNDATKRDITAIRNMGVVMSDLGERRLKGLETTEFVSLLYPKALGGRLRYSTLNQGRPSTATADLGTQLIEALPRALDVMQIQALGILCLRLEAAVAATQPGSAYAAACEPSPTVPSNSPSMSRRKRSIHPYIAAYPVRVDATDEELYAILEGIIIRIENLTNSLVLERLGPYTEVLAALSQATRIDPNLIVRALSLFAGTMRATA